MRTRRSPRPSARQEAPPRTGPPPRSPLALIVVFLVMGIVLLAAVILLERLVTAGPTTDPTATTSTVGPVVDSTSTSKAEEWVVTFEYLFPNETWQVGAHEYVLAASCPSLPAASGRWSVTFQVTAQSRLYSSRVYLRARGVSDSPVGGAFLASVHPDQPLASTYSVTMTSAQQADAARVDCTVTVSLEQRGAEELLPGIPFER